MSKEDFERFLEEKVKSSKEEAAIDWNKEREEWLTHLRRLYESIEEMLGDFIKSGKIKISKHKIALTEENIGSYSADELIIGFGNEKIVLKPIGTLLIGAKGRVDMRGKKRSARLVLVDSRLRGIRDQIRVKITVSEKEGHGDVSVAGEKASDIRWEWRIITSPPESAYLPLNEGTLLSAIVELSDGK